MVDLLDAIKIDFERAKCQEIAQKQASYMQDLFPFLGLKAPDRDFIVKKYLKNITPPLELALNLWKLNEREYQYAACMVLEKYYKKAPATGRDLELIENLIQEKSWWDSVDWLAPRIAGPILLKNPNMRPILDQWNQSDNMWLRRSSLICQLKWKEQTDESRLFRYIDRTCHEREFFIRKAIGWVLREYSKTNPKRVREYLAKKGPSLSPLSIREASKYL